MPSVQEKLHTVYQMLDMDGNLLTLKWHPHNIYTVSIYLVKLKKEREIAQIDVDHACMSMRRLKEMHFLRALCGYGFNWTLINKEMPFYVKNILLIEHEAGDVDYYLIPIEKVKELGEKKHFEAKAGMELQWFMKMTDIIKFRIKDLSVLPTSLINKKQK